MRTLFNDNWEFTLLPLGAAFDDTHKDGLDWKPVDIPHDWMIYDTENLYTSGTGCYRKRFMADGSDASDPDGKKAIALTGRCSLLFDGVYMDSEVYVNGHKACEWKNGYTPFLVDMTEYLTDGENTVTVLVNYREPNTRWYSGAGIFRDVHFIRTEDVHIVHNGVYVTAKPENDGDLAGNWTINVSTELINEGPSDKRCKLKTTLMAFGTGSVFAGCSLADVPAGKPVDYAVLSTDPSKYVTEVHTKATLSAPHLWSLEDPFVYKLKTELILDGKVIDSAENPLGFRTIRADSNEGFFLNGKHIKLNGACMHHDLGALGSAFNVTALERQFKSLRKMGVNAIRTSHNPPAERFLELADKFGMLIDSEFTDMWERHKTANDYAGYFHDWCERDAAAWLRRDRNHPCVIMWSIGNEIYDTYFENEGIPITKRLTGFVRLHDPDMHAFSTIGSNFIDTEGAQKCADLLDVSGYNYKEYLYEEHHKKRPDWVIYGSETSSTVQSRGIYHFPASKRLLTHDDGQCSSLENCSTNWGAATPSSVVYMDRDAKFSLGQFIWTGWDYIGEPTPYFTKNSYFGQADTAGFEKDSYYIYQAEWTDHKKAPMVHLLPYWDFNEGQLIDVRVYSNAPKTELFLNGVSQGTFDIDHENGHQFSGIWQLPYTKGVLKAVAYDENGNVVATDECRSFGDTAKLELISDKETLKANGEDLIFTEIRALDENGMFVANARNRVNVSVSGAGRLVGLDNGDSTDYEQYKGTSRKLFSGRLLAIIAAIKDAGEITLTVKSPSLPTVTKTFTAVKATAREGVSCLGKNYVSEEKNDIPIRKIELCCESSGDNVNGDSNRNNSGNINNGQTVEAQKRLLTPENAAVSVSATVFPANATYSDIAWKALNENAVEANFVKVEATGTNAVVKALGNGEFRLVCSANSGSPFPQVLSEYEFSATGFSELNIDPYKLVYASLRTREKDDKPLNLSFQGGVFAQNGRSWLEFDNVDFGDYGSDEITLPIFHWNPKTKLEIWEGNPDEGGTLLLECEYEHESIYNQYNTNTFKLPNRLSGVKNISIVTYESISLQGFVFSRPEKAFALLNATECSNITGDSFVKNGDEIVNIGNNVSIEFDDMDFGAEGCRSITICGRTRNNENAVTLLFIKAGKPERQMIAFEKADVYTERTFELTPVTGKCKVALVFLPGSDFDLKNIRFGR